MKRIFSSSLAIAAALLLVASTLSADPYTVIRTITHTENALWETAAGDLRPLVALGPDHFVISTKGLRLSGGVAYVFAAADGSFLRRLTAADAAEGMEFGSSLAVDGGYALIGAPRKFLSSTNRGKVYLYDLATGVETLTFNQSDGDTSSDGFGESVALDGTTVVVGAPTAGLAAAMPMEFGRGFVYAFDQGTGTLLRTFAASDWEAIAGLGESVAVKGNDVLAGAPFATVNGIDDVGKAYVYDLATGTERFILSPSDPTLNDYFGFRVSITDDYFVVASPNDDEVLAGSGSVYLFNRTTGAFVRKILANPAAGGGAFGLKHSVSGEVMLESQDFDGTAFGFYGLATGTRTELVSDPAVFGTPAWRGNTLLIARGTSTSDGFTLADGIFTIKVVSDGSGPPPAVSRAPILTYGSKRKINLKRPKLTLRGTASDLDGDLALIEVKVGNKPFTPASGTDSWSASVKGLKPGKNTIQIRSKDAAGNTSTIVKLTVVLK